MKKIFLLLLLISQVIFAGANAEDNYLSLDKELDKISYDSNAKSLSKTTYKVNESSVHYARPFEGIVGIKAVEVDYINGKREGKAIFNHPNGKILAEGIYNQDKKDGLWKYYLVDFLIREQEFKSGIYHGKNVIYYENGNPRTIVNYVNGKREGEVLEYYESGKLWSKATYINNKFEGDIHIYYPSGALYMKAFYKNDLHNGLVTYYYENGNLLLEGEYLKGKPINSWKFYGKDQQVKYNGKYEDISPLFSEEFNENLMKALENN